MVADLEAPFSPELMSGGVVSTVLRKGKCDIKTQLSWNHQPAGNHQFVQSETSAKYILLGSPNNTRLTAAGLARPPRPLLPSLVELAEQRLERVEEAQQTRLMPPLSPSVCITNKRPSGWRASRANALLQPPDGCETTGNAGTRKVAARVEREIGPAPCEHG